MERNLKDETATAALGREFALFCSSGITFCLSGDLGAGKTTLARALIQGLAVDGSFPEVPSPTFSIVQPYDELRFPVHHYDLYRIEQVDEVYELGLFDELEDRITIIEWPEKLDGDLPENRIEIFLAIEDSHRIAKIKGIGNCANIITRLDAVENFLKDGQWSNAERQFLQGDASARRYERLNLANGAVAILMDMPKAPDGPIIKNGKPYSEIAHIAEGIFPVAAINSTLAKMGFSTPKSLQQELASGLMIIEDFGDSVFGTMIDNNQNIDLPMQVATELLADIASKRWPSSADNHTIAEFDLPSFSIETQLLLDWFWPLQKNSDVENQIRNSFSETWTELFPLVQTAQPVWVLRDFHSPNLIWLPERSGIKRVGLIDTQDCLRGHPAYDLVSLLQDARVDLPGNFETKYLEQYCGLRLAQDATFDRHAFEIAYAVLGAQRATKILGIFARLYKRDGKPGYLEHIPRVSAALEKNLQHPALSKLAEWYCANLPVTDRVVREAQ